MPMTPMNSDSSEPRRYQASFPSSAPSTIGPVAVIPVREAVGVVIDADAAVRFPRARTPRARAVELSKRPGVEVVREEHGAGSRTGGRHLAYLPDVREIETVYEDNGQVELDLRDKILAVIRVTVGRR